MGFLLKTEYTEEGVKLTKIKSKINNVASKTILKTSQKARAIKEKIEKLETRKTLAKENGNMRMFNLYSKQIATAKLELKAVYATNGGASIAKALTGSNDEEKNKKLLKKSDADEDDS